MKTGLQVDFDCMVEVAFSDQNAFLAYMGKLFGPEAVDDAVAVEPVIRWAGQTITAT